MVLSATERGFTSRKAMLIHSDDIELCAMTVLLVSFSEKGFPLRRAAATCGFLENAD
jgi:hypothetical protein